MSDTPAHVPVFRRGRETMIHAQLKKRTASGAGNTSGGSDSKPDATGKELLPTMLRPQLDEHPEARPVLFGAPASLPAPAGRHYFVDDPTATGYCAACSLPESNRRRHVARRAA